MRLWSLHPKYLDAKGLVALWREALLAQKVLQGRTRGYRHHPQLERFKACRAPERALASYLYAVWQEAVCRGYAFDRKKIGRRARVKIPVTRGQLRYESRWLLAKLKRRDPARYRQALRKPPFEAHPIFIVRSGPVADWERAVGKFSNHSLM